MGLSTPASYSKPRATHWMIVQVVSQVILDEHEKTIQGLQLLM